jgi:hypothetical protein
MTGMKSLYIEGMRPLKIGTGFSYLLQ